MREYDARRESDERRQEARGAEAMPAHAPAAAVAPFTRTTRVGATRDGNLFVTVEWDGHRLSLTGVEGPRSNGDARGGAGQCLDAVRRVTHFAAGWCKERCEGLATTWERWHLNDMHAGCAHQRALGWQPCPGHYGENPTPCEGGGFKLEDLEPHQSRHHIGLGAGGSVLRCSADAVSKPCPECGYQYGSAWLHEPVPVIVLTALRDLPDDADALPPVWHPRAS